MGTFWSAKYTYTDWGAVATKQDARGVIATYDTLHRLTSVSYNTSGAPTNRLTSVTTSGVTANYTYDSAGNVTNDGSHTYAYDAENRMVSVDGGATASYFYDVSNERYKKVTGGATTHYIWQASQVIAEHNGSTGAVVTDYVYSGSRMIANVSAGSSQYFLSDRLSARMTLNTSGNVSGRQAHLPFGEDFAENGTQEKHHFTSYERDDIGLDYAINRYYSPMVARFLQVDSVEPSSTLRSTLENRYAYADADPLNKTDEKGLSPSGTPGGNARFRLFDEEAPERDEEDGRERLPARDGLVGPPEVSDVEADSISAAKKRERFILLSVRGRITTLIPFPPIPITFAGVVVSGPVAYGPNVVFMLWRVWRDVVRDEPILVSPGGILIVHCVASPALESGSTCHLWLHTRKPLLQRTSWLFHF